MPSLLTKLRQREELIQALSVDIEYLMVQIREHQEAAILENNDPREQAIYAETPAESWDAACMSMIPLLVIEYMRKKGGVWEDTAMIAIERVTIASAVYGQQQRQAGVTLAELPTSTTKH
jgi:hypothetical protein